jgi:hypothetical protein
MCRRLSAIDNALLHLTVTVDLLAVDPVRLECEPMPAEFRELERRQIATRQWAMDPTGLRAGIGPVQYAQERGLL